MTADSEDLYERYSLASDLYSRGEIVESLRTLKPILVSEDSELKKKALVLLAEICQKRKDVDRAIKFFQTALGLATDPFEQATYLNKIGILYRVNHDIPNAIAYQERCLEKVHEIGNRKAEAITLRNLGSLYSMAGRHVDSLRSHQLSLEIKRTIGDIDQYAQSLLIFAQDLDYAGKFEEALEKYNEVKSIYERIGDTQKIKEIDEAIANMKEEEHIRKEYDEKYSIYDDFI
jgi:tetratricopeptide (TPR) repeat protein